MNRRHMVCAAALVTAACAGRGAPTPAPAPVHAGVPAQAAAPTEPTSLRYAAGTGHYRIESRQHIEQEMMGQTTKADITTAMRLTVAVADAAGNLGVGITVDSVDVTLPPGVPPEAGAALAAAKGTTLHLVATPHGQTVSVTQPDSAPAAVRQLLQGLREFLPQLPQSSLAAGTTWSDTATTTTSSQIGPTTVHSNRQYRVVGWEDRDGARALHLSLSATYTLSGSGEAQGQTIELAGGGQRSAEVFVSATGIYLGGMSSDSSLVNANVVSAGMLIPVRTTSHSTIARLP